MATRIILNIVGVMLVLAAIVLVLKGLGWVAQIPSYVIWAMVLLAVGVGILGGLRSSA